MARHGMREYVEQLEREGDMVGTVRAAPTPAPAPPTRPRRGRLLGVLALSLPMLTAAGSQLPDGGGRTTAGVGSEATCELAQEAIEIERLHERVVRAEIEARAVLKALRRRPASRT